MGGVHPQATQGVHRPLPDGVGGQLGDKGGVHAVVGQGHGHVGLPAAEGGLELIVLEKAVVPVGRQPQHNLTEGNDAFLHSKGPPYYQTIKTVSLPAFRLHQMNGNPAERAVHIDGLRLAPGVGLAGLLPAPDALKAQVIDRPVHAVGADGDMTVGAGAGSLGALHRRQGLYGGVAHLIRKAEKGAQRPGQPVRLLLAAAVDAHMVQGEAQHGAYRLPRHSGDFVPVFGRDQVLLHHPGAPAGHDLVEGEVVHQVLCIDPAGGHPLKGLIRPGDRLELGHAAVLFGGKELYHVQAQAHGLLHLAGCGGAGDHQGPLGKDIPYGVRIKTGADDEFRPRVQGPVHLLAGQHGARAHQHLGDLPRDGAHGLLGRGGAEGHFRHRQAARHQRPRQRHRLLRVVDGDHGHNADVGDLFQNGIHMLNLLFCKFTDAWKAPHPAP